MGTYDVAHIHEQEQDMVIVPMKSAFGRLPAHEQEEQIDLLQQCSISAGLRGTVVPVWDDGGGRMAFIAPRPWHGYFSSLNLGIVAAMINKRLTCHG